MDVDWGWIESRHTSCWFVNGIKGNIFYIDRNKKKVKKECCLIKQDNTIYIFSIKLFLSSIEQDSSKLLKQMWKLLILTENTGSLTKIKMT